jgi:hypothetical protein
MNNSPIITLSNKNIKSLGKNTLPYQAAKEREKQRTTSSVPSHHQGITNGSIAELINGTIKVTNQVSSSQYIFTSIIRSSSLSSIGHSIASSNYIQVTTPSYISAPSQVFVSNSRKSDTRQTTTYFYKGGGTLVDTIHSASLGKYLEDGRSFNKYAYSHSLNYAEVSDYNLGGAAGTDRTRYTGAQLSGPDFNINSIHTPDNGPVVSFNIGDPNQIITSDPSFRGNLTIE